VPTKNIARDALGRSLVRGKAMRRGFLSRVSDASSSFFRTPGLAAGDEIALIDPAKAGTLGAAPRDMPRSGSLLVSIPGSDSAACGDSGDRTIRASADHGGQCGQGGRQRLLFCQPPDSVPIRW
jgi:hypothetical protein